MRKFFHAMVLFILSCVNWLHASDHGLSPKGMHVYDDDAKKLFFVIEEVTEKNIAFWENYRAAMLRVSTQLHDDLGAKKDYTQAIKGFQNALDAFKGRQGQIWIAYATTNPEATGYEKMARIEICVTVSTSPGIPIVTHMGIFRSPLQFLDGEKIQNAGQIKEFTDFGIRKIIAQVRKMGGFQDHRGLALKLHSFAARKMHKWDESKTYMVTAPLPHMQTMLERSPLGEAVKRINIEKIKKGRGEIIELKDNEKTIISLTSDQLERAPWLETVTFLSSENPKIAIPLEALANPRVARPRHAEARPAEAHDAEPGAADLRDAKPRDEE